MRAASTPMEERALARGLWHKMVKKLEANRGKEHWLDSEMSFLVGRLYEETAELLEAIEGGDNLAVWNEAADVGNFAAMIAHHHQVNA